MADIRILHVDDEPDVRLLVQASLGLDPGLVTQSCASGAEALAIAAKWQPDLILLDATMPDMDGPATLAQLKGDPQTAGIPVMFLTASCQDSDRDHFKAIGSVGVIAKPFDPRALAPSVRSLAQQLAAEPASTQPAALRLTQPAGADMPDTGLLNQAVAGAGTSMGSTLGQATSAVPGDGSGIVPVDPSGAHAWDLSIVAVTGGSTSSLDAAFEGQLGLLDLDWPQAGSPGASVPDPMMAGSGAAGSLFSGSRASGHDASSDLVHAYVWQGGDPLATGPGHDLWAVTTSVPILQGSKSP